MIFPQTTSLSSSSWKRLPHSTPSTIHTVLPLTIRSNLSHSHTAWESATVTSWRKHPPCRSPSILRSNFPPTNNSPSRLSHTPRIWTNGLTRNGRRYSLNPVEFWVVRLGCFHLFVLLSVLYLCA